MSIILKAENLAYTYEDGTKALNGVSFEIEKGQKTAIVGANGSGKSTLFLCLNAVLRPQTGTIYYQDQPIDYSKKGLLELRSKVGIVFQEPDNQLFSASVYEEISFGVLNLGVCEADARNRVEQVMQELEIKPFRHKPTHFLSGGQKKQVTIADILVMQPDIIIFDEPAAALDPKHTLMVNDIIDRLVAKGITVIVSTHDVDYALKWADKVLVFRQGEMIAQGTAEQIFMDQCVLESANLIQPTVIELYSRLCNKNILENKYPVPTDITHLEKYIEESLRR